MIELNKDLQIFLLNTAKAAIEYYLEYNRKPNRYDLDIQKYQNEKILNQEFAAFVTLKQNHDLRGCIGSLVADKPLIDQIIYQAVNAGFFDNRFQPLSEYEISSIDIEISILSNPQAINHFNEIRIGTDGIILMKNNKSALFLPEVATEQGWDLEIALINLCQKAGLNDYDWMNNTRFETFQSLKFSSSSYIKGN